MLSRLFRSPAANEPHAALPDGRRVYAVGDIHGHADLLDALAHLIAADVAARPAADSVTIFLGDYVDRGPASAAVLDRLADADFPTPILALCGNHDDIFVGFLRGAVDLADYIGVGGDATLRSYGIDPDTYAGRTDTQRAATLAAAIPDAHRAFLDALPLSTAIGDYFFCHAGVRPGVPLDAQLPHDLLWIREPFLGSRADFGKVVVHGHTPLREPLVRRNAIGIDTQAFATGVLTALVLEGAERRFLQTG